MELVWFQNLFKLYENAIIINVRFHFKHIPPCRLKRALYFRRYANEDHQRVATLSCINTILTPAVAVKISRLFPPSLRTLPYTFSLGVSIHGSDGHSGCTTRESTHSTVATCNAYSFAIHLFFFLHFSFSFCDCRSLSPLLIFPLSPSCFSF